MVCTLQDAAVKYGALSPVPAGYTLDSLPNEQNRGSSP